MGRSITFPSSHRRRSPVMVTRLVDGQLDPPVRTLRGGPNQVTDTVLDTVLDRAVLPGFSKVGYAVRSRGWAQLETGRSGRRLGKAMARG